VNTLWIYKPKEEFRKNIFMVCKRIEQDMTKAVTEKLLQMGQEDLMNNLFDVMSSYEKYDTAVTLKINLDSSLVLSEEQYVFLRCFEPKIKDWVDRLRTVET
jgi:hypothetical protein